MSFLKKFPLKKFLIKGHSMEPTFMNGNSVLSIDYMFTKPVLGDVIVFRKRSDIFIKRIAMINNNKYFVVGDNKEQSTDSRNFGYVEKKDIYGKIILKL